MSAEVIIKNGVTIIDNKDDMYIMYRPWYKSSYGYAVRSSPVGIEFLHRYIIGAKKGDEVDHINGDKLDNRKENLRIVSRSENRQNQHQKQRNGKHFSSKYKGVYWNKDTKSWRTRITKNRKAYEGGLFNDEKGAARKYNELALIHYGEHAMINNLNEE